MKLALLPYLVSPCCHSPLEATLKEQDSDGDYLSGQLQCQNCRKEFLIRKGVPRLISKELEKRGPQETFGFEWKKHGEKKLEGETVWGMSQAEEVSYFLEALQLQREELKDKIILDVGCGSGQLTEGLSRLAKTVIGMDIHAAIEFPFERCRKHLNTHIVQADLFDLPFKPGTFDIVWSNGVIHHTDNPRRAFHFLSRSVKESGRLYIWVYEKRNSPFRLTKNFLDKWGLNKLSLDVIYVFCKVIKFPSFLLHTLYRWALKIFLKNFSSEFKIKTRYRSLKEIELTWFDALSPKYVHCFTEPEVHEWFKTEGFPRLLPYPKNRIGACGIKQN